MLAMPTATTSKPLKVFQLSSSASAIYLLKVEDLDATNEILSPSADIWLIEAWRASRNSAIY